jgi:xylulokinase
LSGHGALIGLDVGTTGARAIAIDLAGSVVAQASHEYPLSSPRPGWSEQDPEHWWVAAQAVLRRVMGELRERPLGLALTGQMHGAVFLDAHDQVIRPAILWNDQRTASQCRSMEKTVARERLIEITGNPAITGFQAPKILWLREEEPAAYARVARVLLPKDFIRLRLTGDAATDASDASGTSLLDLRRRDWSGELLDAFGIPLRWLPEVHEGPEVTGVISASASETTELPRGTPVAAGGGDNAAAAVGNGIVEEGLASSSIGTSGVVFAHTDRLRIDPAGRLHAFCHAIPGSYHVMGVTLSAGASLRWWRDAMGADLDYDGMSALAAQAQPGSGGLIFLPYLTGERTPHLDPLARGAFAGLSAHHSQADLTRAVMEGVVHSLTDCLDLIVDLGLAVREIRATGGGARSAFWRQMQSDMYGIPVRRTRSDEGPAFGAALLAGVAAGVFSDVRQACALIALDPDAHAPDPNLHRLYSARHAAFTSLYAELAPDMHRLALDQRNVPPNRTTGDNP